MAENTKIAWATHSFSPWIGCSKVASGCANCYAEAMARRLGVTWGPQGTRRRTAKSTWGEVERWNRKAACSCNAKTETCETCLTGSPRVFPSLCDPFEEYVLPVLVRPGYTQSMDFVRRDFFALIDRTSNLDWLLLTKRPENVLRMWPARDFGRATMQSVMDSADHPGGYYRPNCWLLYSASDQASLDAGLPHLLACRDLVPVLGLSLEPLIGPVLIDLDGIDWVIVGGESGPGFRPMVIDWVRSIADQCAAAGVSCFIKQDCGRKPGQQGRIPDDLWSLKQFPKV